MTTNLFQSRDYQTVAESILRAGAKEGADTEITTVTFAEGKPEGDHSWVCAVVDPHADDLMAGYTVSSAADHVRTNQNGFLATAEGDRIAVTVIDIEASDSALMIIDGKPFSPFVAGLAVLRISFNYTRDDQPPT